MIGNKINIVIGRLTQGIFFLLYLIKTSKAESHSNSMVSQPAGNIHKLKAY